MSVGALLAGTRVEVVGVEDQDDGSVRVYLTQRSKGVYAVIADEGIIRRLRDAWHSSQRVTIPTPPAECVFWDGPPRVKRTCRDCGAPYTVPAEHGDSGSKWVSLCPSCLYWEV